MTTPTPTIIALDFDGVICNGLIEYFQTAWRTYCQIWSSDNPTPPEGLAESFYRLRPVIETGWEMPVLLRAKWQGRSEAEILQNWEAIARQIVSDDNLDRAEVAATLDGLRDRWIVSDLPGWLSLHQFYPGVVEWLRKLLDSAVQPIIITTKEGRFVRSLLKQEGIELPPDRLFGKESQRPKFQILRELLTKYTDGGNPPTIWFVEDRLKTLQLVQQQPDLNGVRLYLADWGYNTQKARDSIAHDARIHLISLQQFSQEFEVWP